MTTTAINNPYCIHEEPCEDCERPRNIHDCNFCGEDAEDSIEDNDPNVGYYSRIWFCQKCTDRI